VHFVVEYSNARTITHYFMSPHARSMPRRKTGFGRKSEKLLLLREGHLIEIYLGITYIILNLDLSVKYKLVRV
jgi:hypothetical protein